MITCKGCGESGIKETMYKYDDPPNAGWYCILCAYGIERRIRRIAREQFGDGVPHRGLTVPALA